MTETAVVLLKGVCKRCGKERSFDAEKCRPKARAKFPDGTIKEWTIKQALADMAVYVCSCGQFGIAKKKEGESQP